MKWSKWLLALGLGIMAVFLLCSIAPDLMAPYGVKEMSKAWLAPGNDHILGTNDLGYDIFSELVYAARSTLTVGIASAFISLVIGTGIGLAAGYLPGWRKEAADGIIQVFLMLPMLPMAIVIGAFTGTDTRNIILIIAVLGWCATARTVSIRDRKSVV